MQSSGGLISKNMVQFQVLKTIGTLKPFEIKTSL